MMNLNFALVVLSAAGALARRNRRLEIERQKNAVLRRRVKNLRDVIAEQQKQAREMAA